MTNSNWKNRLGKKTICIFCNCRVGDKSLCPFCGSFLGSEENYISYCFDKYPIEFEEELSSFFNFV